VNSEKEELEGTLVKMFKVLNEDNLKDGLKDSQLYNMSYLSQNFGLNEADLDALYRYGKYHYELGNYKEAGKHLYNFRALSSDGDKNLNALWGLLAIDILQGNYEEAFETFTKLKDHIEKRSFALVTDQLNQRAWLINWAIFFFFKLPNGGNLLTNLLLEESYKSTIQITCRHMLKYLIAAALLNDKRNVLRESVLALIKSEKHEYSDSFTEFIENLYDKFDFDTALGNIDAIADACSKDYFLHELKDRIVERAKIAIFDTYSRLHRTVELKYLAEKLKLSEEDAELWIIDLIRDSKLEAQFDSEKGIVCMETKAPNFHAKIFEKTRALLLRSNILLKNVGERLAEKERKNSN